MFHLFVSLLSYFVAIFLQSLSYEYKVSFIILGFVAFVRFGFELSEKQKNKVFEIIKESQNKKKEELPYIIAELEYELNARVPYLKEYVIFLFTYDGKKEARLLTNNIHIVRQIKSHGGKMKIYYYENFIVSVEYI